MDEARRAKCGRYIGRVLALIPSAAEEKDASHAAIVYFCVLALHVLGKPINPKEIEEYTDALWTGNGYRMNVSYATNATHLTATYFCLALRAMSGLSLPAFKSIQPFIAECQSKDGVFCATPGGEPSLRHTYAAFAVAKLTGEIEKHEMWDKASNYILSCQSYDGGFGDKQFDESHAGLTYCAVASLRMYGALSKADMSLNSFLAKRQTDAGGHNGRLNKDADVCYSFWVLCSLQVVGFRPSDESANAAKDYLLGPGFDNLLGGFAKVPGETADPYHTALALGALSVLHTDGLAEFDPLLSIVRSS